MHSVTTGVGQRAKGQHRSHQNWTSMYSLLLKGFAMTSSTCKPECPQQGVGCGAVTAHAHHRRAQQACTAAYNVIEQTCAQT